MAFCQQASWIWLLIGTPLVLLAEDDAESILNRVITAENANAQRGAQFTFIEHKDDFAFDKDSQPHKRASETHEVIFVEGESFRKLIARNDLPLSPKEQAAEEARLKEAAAERRKRRRAGSVLQKEISLGSRAELLTLFDCALTGAEEVRGRRSWVIECAPKRGKVPKGRHEKEAMSMAQKLWIDQGSGLVAREIQTALGTNALFLPGSTLEWRNEPVGQETWLATSMVINGQVHFAKLIKPSVRTEYRYSKFQKFDVKSTITVE